MLLKGGSQGVAVVVAPIQNSICISGTTRSGDVLRKAVIPNGRSAAKPPYPNRRELATALPCQIAYYVGMARRHCDENKGGRRVVGKILSNSGQRSNYIDPMLPQMLRITDPREHQQMR